MWRPRRSRNRIHNPQLRTHSLTRRLLLRHRWLNTRRIRGRAPRTTMRKYGLENRRHLTTSPTGSMFSQRMTRKKIRKTSPIIEKIATRSKRAAKGYEDENLYLERSFRRRARGCQGRKPSFTELCRILLRHWKRRAARHENGQILVRKSSTEREYSCHF